MRRIAQPLAIMLSAQSGPGQKHAFDDALAHMGCPGRRTTGFRITSVCPSQLDWLGFPCHVDHAASAFGSL